MKWCSLHGEMTPRRGPPAQPLPDGFKGLNPVLLLLEPHLPWLQAIGGSRSWGSLILSEDAGGLALGLVPLPHRMWPEHTLLPLCTQW